MKKFNTVFAFLFTLLLTQLQAQEGRYCSQVFDEVDVTTSLVYGENAEVLLVGIVGEALKVPLVFDFYEPRGDDETERPLVIYFHTGNFLPVLLNASTQGTRTDSSVVEVVTRLAKMGYVVAAVDYRLGWNPTAETQPERALGLIQAAYRGIQDARTAIRYFKKTYAEDGNPHQVDTSRIVLWGQGTGGYITLGAATLSDFSEILTTQFPPGKFLTDLDGDPNTLEPMVIPSINGDIYGTSVGIVPETGFGPFPAGDTLNYINWPGYSSEFQLCVNMGGAMGDLSWLEAGDPAMITYQAPNDPFAPYESAVLIVPTTGDPIVEVQGGKLVINKALDLGNNAVFEGISGLKDDPYTQAAMAASVTAGHDYYEGLFPLVRSTNVFLQEEGDPWTWWDSEFWGAIDHPSGLGSYDFVGKLNNADMSAEKARMYIDSIVGYFAPRACGVLNLSTGIEEILTSSDVTLKISPNPASQSVLLQTDTENPMLEVALYDINGKQLQLISNINDHTVSIDRQGLPPGIYLVKIRFVEGILTQKIIFK